MANEVALDDEAIERILQDTIDVRVEAVPGETSLPADGNDEDGVGWHVERIVIYVKKSTTPRDED